MAENKFYIADASVILKWFLEEDDSEVSLKILDDFRDNRIDIGILGHTIFEVMNVLIMKVSKEAGRYFSFLNMLGLSYVELSEADVKVAGDLIKKGLKLSFYDAAYHAVAMNQRGIFITADERYFEQTKKVGSSMLLKNYL